MFYITSSENMNIFPQMFKNNSLDCSFKHLFDVTWYYP